MRAKILDYDFRSNRAVIQFDTDFSTIADKFRDKAVEVTFKLWRSKRSLAANRYMWVLCDKIAAETLTSKDDVYRSALREIGGVSDILQMQDAAVPRFCQEWKEKGLGWQTEVAQSADGWTNVIVYYGSSTFTVDQMTQLIEFLIFEAEKLDIDTETPDKQLWWESLQKEAKGQK